MSSNEGWRPESVDFPEFNLSPEGVKRVALNAAIKLAANRRAMDRLRSAEGSYRLHQSEHDKRVASLHAERREIGNLCEGLDLIAPFVRHSEEGGEKWYRLVEAQADELYSQAQTVQ